MIDCIYGRPSLANHEIFDIDLMTAPTSQQESQTRQRWSSLSSRDTHNEQSPDVDLSPKPHEFPLVCQKIRCIFGIGSERGSYQETNA
jgi:hypothetical protein